MPLYLFAKRSAAVRQSEQKPVESLDCNVSGLGAGDYTPNAKTSFNYKIAGLKLVLKNVCSFCRRLS